MSSSRKRSGPPLPPWNPRTASVPSSRPPTSRLGEQRQQPASGGGASRQLTDLDMEWQRGGESDGRISRARACGGGASPAWRHRLLLGLPEAAGRKPLQYPGAPGALFAWVAVRPSDRLLHCNLFRGDGTLGGSGFGDEPQSRRRSGGLEPSRHRVTLRLLGCVWVRLHRSSVPRPAGNGAGPRFDAGAIEATRLGRTPVETFPARPPAGSDAGRPCRHVPGMTTRRAVAAYQTAPFTPARAARPAHPASPATGRGQSGERRGERAGGRAGTRSRHRRLGRQRGARSPDRSSVLAAAVGSCFSCPSQQRSHGAPTASHSQPRVRIRR